jgi:hypothetical protein
VWLPSIFDFLLMVRAAHAVRPMAPQGRAGPVEQGKQSLWWAIAAGFTGAEPVAVPPGAAL